MSGNRNSVAMSEIMTPEVIESVQKELAERKLSHFIRIMWRYLDPATFISGWHLEAICEHLEAVYRGEIRNLLITMPPRHMKSIGVSVAFPAWCWIQEKIAGGVGMGAEEQFLFASYAQTLSIRDSTKCRRLIESPLYQKFWGEKFTLTSDQNTKIRFENDKGGYRIATSVGGVVTGEGGSIIVVDDPHNVLEAESEVTRMGTLAWWDEAMSTRLNNPKTGRKVVVQQRVHQNDLAGHVMEQGGWVHLNLPARYEEENKCVTPIWTDPRTRDGQLLWPDRFGEKEMIILENSLGIYGAASQLQQRPTPRKGGMFLPEQIQVIDHPGLCGSPIAQTVRMWDKAGSKDAGAYTAGVKMARTNDGKYIILDVVRGQWRYDVREKVIKQTAQMDGYNVVIKIEQEPGSGGKESAENTVTNLAGFHVITERPTGDKANRAEPFSSQVNIGNVYMIRADWNKAFIEELRMFPFGKFKDQVDGASGAFNHLCKRKNVGVW